MSEKKPLGPVAATGSRRPPPWTIAVSLLGVILLGACSSRPASTATKPTATSLPPVAATQTPKKPTAVPTTPPQQRPGLTTGTAVTATPLPPPGAAARPDARTATATANPATVRPAVQSATLPPPAATTAVAVRAPTAAPAATPGAPPTAAATPGFVITRPLQPTAATTASTAAPAAPAAPAPAISAATPGNATNPQAADEVIGDLRIYTAKYQDTLLDVAIDNDMGFLEIAAANQGVDPWLPGAGTKVLLPKARILPTAPREGLVINIPEQRMYVFRKGDLIETYPIGVFRDGFSTPIGATQIVRKAVNPTWYPTESARSDSPELPAAVPPGPDNPLGSRAMYLGWARYVIHGTNKPYGVGRRVSRGCIRMQSADAEALFETVAVGTPVHTVSQTVKVGWWRGELFVQAHPTIAQGVALEETGKIDPIEVPEVREKVTAKAGAFADRVDWTAVETALKERRGIPVQITNRQVPVAEAPSLQPVIQAQASALPPSLPAASPGVRQ